jgi:chromosome transmission fidelity protein 4
LIGAVCSIDSGTHHTIDVTFHDQSIRPFHFTDHNQFKLACLDYHGAIFCSEATSILPSIISYHPVDTWQKNDWTIELPLGESCEAVAMNNTCIIVATTMNFLRLFSISGIQIGLKSLSGPILSMAGSGASIIIAYHSGSAFNGFSNSSYFILDTETMTTTLTGSLALSPSATLSWIGFSKTGIPITYDSVGILRGLLVNQDQSWTPFLDARRLELLEGDSCWAVGVTATHFMCVLVRVFEIYFRVPNSRHSQSL